MEGENINLSFKISVAETSQESYSPYSNICPITGWTGAKVYHSGADTGNPDVLSITFPTEAGTVYGGTLDVTNGVLTVDRAIVDLGTLSWTIYSSPDRHVFRSSYPIPRPFIGDSALLPHAICSSYYPMAYSPISSKDNGAFSLGRERVVVIEHRFTDVSSFATAVQGVQLCYELAEPITYQLTPQQINTILGTNNVWSDTGDSDVEYPADTKLYIDKKLR